MSNKDYFRIDEMILWDKNPREISDESYNRLLQHLSDEGELEPILLNTGKNWGERGLVISGNNRVPAWKALGKDKLWIEWVDVKSESHMVKLATIKNAQYAKNIPDKYVELIKFLAPEDLSGLDISLATPVPLASLVAHYDPPKLPDMPNSPLETSAPTEPEQDDKNTYSSAYLDPAAIKQVNLLFSSAEYNEVIEFVEDLKAELDVESTSEVFIELMNFWKANHETDNS